MPLSGRSRPEGDKERTTRTQEQELKRARGAISCAECRRLKLKCDKTVPCSSCKRRGCASICPNGSLTTGQGTRFILADTDRLHRKIAEMSDRIRQLEDALGILQSSVTREPHPLLSNDLLKIKSGLELHSASQSGGGGGGGGIEVQENEEQEQEEVHYVEAFGTLAVRDDGAATFYGRSAGSESLLIDDRPQLALSTLGRSSGAHPDLPLEINHLAETFPSGPSVIAVQELQELIQNYLPPWQRASQLRDLYLEQAPWFFGAVTQRQLDEEVLPLFYEEAADEVRTRMNMGASAGPSGIGKLGSTAEAFNLPAPGVRPSLHDLALMFVIFCFGALTDPSLPAAPHNNEATMYYQLTRAALSLEPVLERPPSVTTVQTLSLMGIYQGMVADEHSIETTWALMGLSSKLAQSVGLHRDSARWKLPTSEVQKRRALFWELFITDCWQALATGRLPTFSLQFVDAELPADPDQTLADDGTPQPSFPAWKARWGKECVSSVVMGTLTAQAPKYSVILDLDRRIRDTPLPKYAQGPPPRGAGLAQTMSHYMPTNYLHLTMLYVHRCFFAQAIMDNPNDPMRSPYAPSFLAGYRSACALLSSLREQFALFPSQIARFWVLWTHAFSACVMMGSVVTRGGTSKTAQAALSELRVACDLFERAAKHGGRAGKFLPVVRKLHEKAQAAYFKGFQPLRRDIFTPRADENEQFDELSIFSGRTARTVVTKSNRPSRISPSTSSAATPPDPYTSGSQSGSDPRSSHSPAAEAFPALDSSYRDAIHPSLVDELKTFEGQLETQINQTHAYYAHMTGAPPSEPSPPTSTYGSTPHNFVQPSQQHYEQQYRSHHPQQNVSPPTDRIQHEYPAQYIQPQQNQYPAYQAEPQQRRTSYHAPAPPTHNAPSSQPSHVSMGTVDRHDIPMYGGFSRVSPGHQYDVYTHQGSTVGQSPYGVDAVPAQRSELWSVNVPMVEDRSTQAHRSHQYDTSPIYPQPLDEHVPHSQHSQQTAHQQPAVTQPYPHSHVHPQQSPGQFVQGQQYAYTQGVQPPPPAPLVHVHTGGYSLQETWTSFFQQELPMPPQGGPAPTIPQNMTAK
ncbi:fungal-specific transcription factor domain-containing protein [Trametes punicea]|nr:fungal-specific transcription factor domain-containing protein [Trametes punicea]